MFQPFLLRLKQVIPKSHFLVRDELKSPLNINRKMRVFIYTRIWQNFHTCPAKFPHVWKYIYTRIQIYGYTYARKFADKYIE